MASGQDIRITDVPFSSVPSTESTVFINDNGKLRQTDLTTIAKYSELYTAIIEAHNTGLQSLETTKTQLEQALVDLTNEKFEIINKDHTENLAELTALYENSVQNINALIENGHDKLLNDIAAVDDLRIKVAELNNNLDNKQPKGDYALSNHNHSGVYQPVGNYSVSGHTHDDRYYTESEIDSKLNGKANSSHTHDDRYYTESEIDSKLNGKANSSHTHDNRYYTKTEINNKLGIAALKGVIASTSYSINGMSDYTVTITLTNNDNRYVLFDAYIRTTGWSGVIPQGMTIDAKTNKVSITLFNVNSSNISSAAISICGIYVRQS